MNLKFYLTCFLAIIGNWFFAYLTVWCIPISYILWSFPIALYLFIWWPIYIFKKICGLDLIEKEHKKH